MEYRIRKPVLADAQSIFEIEGICFPAEEAATLAAITHRIEAFDDTFFVLEEKTECNNFKMVGFTNGCRSIHNRINDDMFLPTCKNDANGDYVLIFSLSILPECRNKQYGKILLEHLREVCKNNGVKEIILTCKDKYIKYYASVGYENLGISESTHGGAVWYDMALQLS